MISRNIATAVMVSVFALGALAGPALADGNGHHRGGHRHGNHWNDQRRVYYGPPRVVYAPPPRVVYVQPRVFYAPPPVMYEPASPSINFIFPLR